jgi:radical SAM protein with 4Fe4S-binding SPASM domain
LDGATKATNDRIRVGADFDKIIENIKILKTIQQDNGVSAPYINFVFTAMRSNIHELSSLVELAASLGAEEVKVVYLTVFSKELLSESLIDSQALVSKYFDEATELSAKLGIKLKLPYIQGEDVGKNLPHKDCFVGWRDLFLASDGTARPCQSTSMKFSKISEFDNVLELWNSRQIQEFRGSVNDATKMPIECMKCYQSSHANWNQPHAFIQVNNCFAPKWEK